MRNRLSVAVALVAILGVSVALVPGAPAALQDSFARLTKVREDLVAVKAELGMYSCCIDPSCNFCALATGMCPCGDNVDRPTGVCGECLLGWKAGQGNIAGVNPDDVQPMSGEMLEMMYRQRAQSTPGGDAAEIAAMLMHRRGEGHGHHAGH